MTTYFDGGTIWLGAGRPVAQALLVREGRIAAVGDEAERLAGELGASGVEHVDLDGGFLMAAF